MVSNKLPISLLKDCGVSYFLALLVANITCFFEGERAMIIQTNQAIIRALISREKIQLSRDILHHNLPEKIAEKRVTKGVRSPLPLSNTISEKIWSDTSAVNVRIFPDFPVPQPDTRNARYRPSPAGPVPGSNL